MSYAVDKLIAARAVLSQAKSDCDFIYATREQIADLFKDDPAEQAMALALWDRSQEVDLG